MMSRDLRTSWLVWLVVIAAAVHLHWDAAQGGKIIANIHNDRVALADLASKVRDRVRVTESTFEVVLEGQPKEAEAQEQPPPPPEDPKKKDKEKPVVQSPTPAKPDAPKPEEKKLAIEVKKEENKVTPPAKLLEEKRIAVRQHAKPDQEDNPNAKFISDEANKVEEESVATQTSHDQNDPNPTPGGNHAGADPRMGDSDKTKIAESEEHAGEKNRAPGEKGTEFQVQHEPPPDQPMGPVATKGPSAQTPPQAGGDGQQPANSRGGEAAPGAATTSPDVVTAPGGTWSFNPIRPGVTGGMPMNPGQQNPSNKGRGANAPSVNLMGLGGKAGPGQINLNLNQQGVVAIVGQDQLRKERLADGERRKSEHRGSWIASNFERWRSAIENYVSSVKPGNTTALNTAKVPFATYLNSMHNRIHPIFADSFLGSLDGLPATHPLNDQKLMTRLEIVLTRDGQLHHMGIVKTSGITAFDIAALDSVQRASPFGTAPSAIVSPDGRVYLHWEFHRDDYACSTINARPFMLTAPPSTPPEDPAPPPLPPRPRPNEGPPPVNTPDTRQGSLLPATSPTRTRSSG
ncbi:TonB C-terminal domain-containing protein [Pendulispora albinea]|uniref:TonB C-terminal domain-containing protein n=1 Tax=Pendulispora albinea TaxID=2741071 RepID=A0ABZ2LS68_9BACT